MLAAAIIFADSHQEHMDELTRRRTMASIPFGGRYRLVDFALSNLVNADITKVAVVTQRNYQSLMDHIGSGKDWDLSRRNGGVMIFPPYSYYKNETLAENRLDYLRSVMGYISKCQEDHIVLLDCDSVNVIDFDEVLKQHIDNNADITICYKKTEITEALENNMSFELDENGRVIKASLKSEVGKTANTSINAWVVKRKLLFNLISDSIVRGAKSFRKDILMPNVESLRMFGYRHDGVYLKINSMESYFEQNMQMLNKDIRNQIFGENEVIYTKVRDSAPTKYGAASKVVNSYIADGCEIEGTVINSILFRGVRVGKDAVVENSILMQDTDTGELVKLNYVITDKNVTIRNNQTLSGCKTVPYYLSKNMMV
jgi:glucose-1-phosphate adenylyltransferase